jgi:hypothetical protein
LVKIVYRCHLEITSVARHPADILRHPSAWKILSANFALTEF